MPPTRTPANINLVFPSQEAINHDLRRLVAQFILTPVTVVQSRFIARSMKSYYADHKDKGIENQFQTPEDESMWMVMTDINIRSVPSFPDTYEAAITFEYFEDRIFGDRLRMLVGKEDVAVKYARKLAINGVNLVSNSDKLKIQKAEDYQDSDQINVTMNPRPREFLTACGVAESLASLATTGRVFASKCCDWWSAAGTNEKTPVPLNRRRE